MVVRKTPWFYSSDAIPREIKKILKNLDKLNVDKTASKNFFLLQGECNRKL